MHASAIQTQPQVGSNRIFCCWPKHLNKGPDRRDAKSLVLPNIIEAEGFKSMLAVIPYQNKSSAVKDGSAQRV